MIDQVQYDNMIKAANGHGWINSALETKTKEELMNEVDEERYFHEVIKKLSVRIVLGLGPSRFEFTMKELAEKNADELFEIIKTRNL